MSVDDNDATELLRVDPSPSVLDCFGPITRSTVGGGLRRCNRIAKNGRKCMMVFTSKFNPTCANSTTTSVACCLYKGDKGLYMPAYATWMSLRVSPGGVRAMSRWPSDRSESSMLRARRSKSTWRSWGRNSIWGNHATRSVGRG